MLLPAVSRSALRDAATHAQLEETVTALAVEYFRLRHGKIPETLEAPAPQHKKSTNTNTYDLTFTVAR